MNHKVLFLDIDGVLNNHYFDGIDQRKTAILNYTLDRVSTLKIVISSAWRQYIFGGEMTVKGFETMLRACGLRCYGRVIGATENSEFDLDRDGRAMLIRKWARANSVGHWCAVDDMDIPLPSSHFVRTNPEIGITESDAQALTAIFRNAPIPDPHGEETIDRFMIRRQQAGKDHEP